MVDSRPINYRVLCHEGLYSIGDNLYSTESFIQLERIVGGTGRKARHKPNEPRNTFSQSLVFGQIYLGGSPKHLDVTRLSIISLTLSCNLKTF